MNKKIIGIIVTIIAICVIGVITYFALNYKNLKGNKNNNTVVENKKDDSEEKGNDSKQEESDHKDNQSSNKKL